MHRHPPKRTHMQERFPNQQRGTAPEGGRRGPNGPEEREGQEERERDERIIILHIYIAFLWEEEEESGGGGSPSAFQLHSDCSFIVVLLRGGRREGGDGEQLHCNALTMKDTASAMQSDCNDAKQCDCNAIRLQCKHDATATQCVCNAMRLQCNAMQCGAGRKSEEGGREEGRGSGREKGEEY